MLCPSFEDTVFEEEHEEDEEREKMGLASRCDQRGSMRVVQAASNTTFWGWG